MLETSIQPSLTSEILKPFFGVITIGGFDEFLRRVFDFNTRTTFIFFFLPKGLGLLWCQFVILTSSVFLSI